MASNNAINTPLITLDDTFTVSGDFPTTLTVTGSTNVTLPTSGTVATTDQITSLTWSVVSGVTQTIVANHGYVTDNISSITFTLPATAVVGDTFAIYGASAGFFTITQNSGQTIQIGSNATTTGISGSLISTSVGDSLTIVCTATNNNFGVLSTVGNISFV